MQVSVRNARDRTLTTLLKLAANSFGKALLSPQMLKNINLKIIIRDQLDAGGYCDYDQDDLACPRDFTIEICRTRKKINMFKVLAHEMVHVKQIASGKLKTTNRKIVWNGKSYKSSTPYLSRPWEVEAFQKQEIIHQPHQQKHNPQTNLASTLGYLYTTVECHGRSFQQPFFLQSLHE